MSRNHIWTEICYFKTVTVICVMLISVRVILIEITKIPLWNKISMSNRLMNNKRIGIVKFKIKIKIIYQVK